MLSRRRRLEKLEKSPLFQPPPDPFRAVTALAPREMSAEHLELLAAVVGVMSCDDRRVLGVLLRCGALGLLLSSCSSDI